MFEKKRFNSESSLTNFEKESILKLVNDYPLIYFKATKIKRKLKLSCSALSISRFLKKSNYKLHLLKSSYFLNETNLDLKNLFCNLVKNLTKEQWSSVIFTDEKILQSYSNARMKCFRLRICKRKGRGFDKKYNYRREVQHRFKLNLYGFITSNGLGQLFVFKNKATGEDYVDNLETKILPAIREMKTDFVLQQDNRKISFFMNCMIMIVVF